MYSQVISNADLANLRALGTDNPNAALERDIAAEDIIILKKPEMPAITEKMALLAGLSTADLIKLMNGLAEEKQDAGAKVGPLLTKMKDDEMVYPYVVYLSMLRGFSPVLSLPHSGQGGTILKGFKIKHPALLKFEPVVQVERNPNGLTKREDLIQAKTLQALKQVKLGVKLDDKWKNYAGGMVVPYGSPAYFLESPSGARMEGQTIEKEGFDFLVGERPTISKEELQPFGTWETCTLVKVPITVRGYWIGESDAEKFTGTLTKLCLDCVEYPKSVEDTQEGSIILADAATGNLKEYCQGILDGKVDLLPMPQCWSGQETSKGAPTAETSAALTYCLTGKRILKTQQTDAIRSEDGEIVKSYDYIWDSEPFVELQNVVTEATVRTVVMGRWLDPWMAGILRSHLEGKNGYVFLEKEGQTYLFHQCEVRFEIFPGTMETSTQLENLSASAKGSMFTELVTVPGLMV